VVNSKLEAALIRAAHMEGRTAVDDTIYSYFHENLATVTKEELLIALKNALESATYWRDACLSWHPSIQGGNEGSMEIGRR